MAKKKIDATQADVQPRMVIQNCTFQGSDSEGVLALARALEENAKAIHALCDSVRTAGPLLTIMDGKPV